jgi:adenine-specific DNA-methyltransferase
MDKQQNLTNDIKVPNKDWEALKKHFPQCFDKDGNFLIEKFTKNLAEKEVNFSTESYGLDWLGKSYARLLASDPATTLLRADEKHNAQAENAKSENILIKGDNLEVLKHLSNAYHEKVKMIYIDPPYNTGGDGFVYQDDRKFTVRELQQLIGLSEEKAKRILTFTQAKSNSHSAWLTFMYPRLYIAKHLLKDDGVIFISIDDNEVAQLRLLMDEVFGEENFVAEMVWKKKQGGGNDSKSIVVEHEYIIFYSKKQESINLNLDKNHVLDDALYPNKDIDGEYGLITLDKSSIQFSQSLVFEITDKNGNVYFPRIIKGKQSCWRWGKKTVEKDFDKLVFKDGKVYTKYYRPLGVVAKSLLVDARFGRTETGQDDIKAIFNDNAPFSYPKPVSLIRHIIEIGTSKDDLILDFFAGSGTTGDAVMQLNAEDGGNRKYILVQIPEAIDAKKSKAAFDFVKDELKAEPTIFEITKERLIRAAKKTKENLDTKIAAKEKEIKAIEGKLDLEDKEETVLQLNADISALQTQNLGFKVFETMPIWEDYEYEAAELDHQATLFDESKMTEDDLNALLITWKTNDGIALTQDLQTIDLGGYLAYFGKGKLYLMHKGFTTDSLITLLEKIDSDKEFNPRSIIAFGYHFDSKNLRELSESMKSYTNKKNIDIDFITRY